MKKQVKKLVLAKETIHNLNREALGAVDGGWDGSPLSAVLGTCPCAVSVVDCIPEAPADQ